MYLNVDIKNGYIHINTECLCPNICYLSQKLLIGLVWTFLIFSFRHAACEVPQRFNKMIEKTYTWIIIPVGKW